MKPRILIITTSKDLSKALFEANDCIKLLKPLILYYDSPKAEIKRIPKDIEFVYFRDPFNDESISAQQAKVIAEAVLNRFQGAYSVDKIEKFTDILFEDKWNQYNIFSDIMPATSLLTSIKTPITKKVLVKKRISARSKGIIFNSKDFPDNAKSQDYIVQPRLKLKLEYRVNLIGGQIMKPAVVKSSKKSALQKVRLLKSINNLDSYMVEIAKNVYKKTGLDFVGLDIAKLDTGHILIEVNRSPQFHAYYSLTGINLASDLYRYLLKVLNK